MCERVQRCASACERVAGAWAESLGRRNASALAAVAGHCDTAAMLGWRAPCPDSTAAARPATSRPEGDAAWRALPGAEAGWGDVRYAEEELMRGSDECEIVTVEFGAADIGERIYAFDIVYPRCVIGTAPDPAGRHQIHVYDLTSMKKVEQIVSPLTHQMRTIAIFPDGLGFAVGSVEGRVGIQYFQEKSKNFAFRCHRETPPQRNSECLVYPVNSITFNRKWSTFATAGGDGIFSFWDKDTKQKLKEFGKCGQTISAGAFQQTHDAHTMPLYVYAISYDYHKGPEYLKEGERHTLWLHMTQDDEIKPKPGARR